MSRLDTDKYTYFNTDHVCFTIRILISCRLLFIAPTIPFKKPDMVISSYMTVKTKIINNRL